MIRNIFILAYRYLIKYRIHTFINIIGLAIGFTAYILVSLFVNFEYSWDKQNVNYERIYRVQRHFVKAQHPTDGNNISPHTRGITAKLLYPRFPEIENVMILKELNGMFLSSNLTKPFFDDKDGIAAEQSILQIFTYDFITGNKETALVDPYSIVLSQTEANKLFPDGHSVGKTVMMEKKFALKVTGVYRDLPQNSTIRPVYIVSLSTLNVNNEDAQNSSAGYYMIYVILKPGQNYMALNQKIWNLFKGYVNYEDEKIKLCPLPRLYLHFNDQTALETILYLYQLIGVFILLLSAFNYVNLTTANSSVRAKEIGVRKVNGCSQWVLAAQFLGETIVLSIIAINLAFLFTELILPVFNQIVHKQLTLSYDTNVIFILKMASIALLTGIMSGIYPAFVMSLQKVTTLFRVNMFKSRHERFSLKKLLVTFQFSISIFLIVLSLGFALQIKYMMNKDLGFNKENVLYASLNVTKKGDNFELLRNRILRHPEITNCAMSLNVPFVSFGGGSINWEGCIPGDILEIRNNDVSFDFVKNFEIKIVEGRDFSREFCADVGSACLINKTAWRYLGYENPIGKHIDNGRLLIVGVMQDYHITDMYNTIEPVVLKLISDTISEGKWTFSFRVQPGKFYEAQKSINQELEAFFPNDPFIVQVLSDTFRADSVFKILGSINNSLLFFTILNILLAILGLIGLVSFSTQRRTKEIGIRKINGSSSFQIFLLLSKENFTLMLVASAISWPFGYLALVHLPGNYKMPMPFWIFGFATIIILLISAGTSSYHMIKAANTNPVKTLRYE